MQFRIVMLAIVGALIAFSASRDMSLLGALLAGVVAGAALGWFGLQHTKFETTPQGSFYTPHTYIGIFVSLLLGRIAYRFLTLYPSMHTATQADQDPFSAYQKSPLTLAIFGVVVGYYIFYYVGVLRTSKSLSPVVLTAAEK